MAIGDNLDVPLGRGDVYDCAKLILIQLDVLASLGPSGFDCSPIETGG